MLAHSASVTSVTHYTMVRTIADALSIPAPGLAASTFPVSDVWDAITPVRGKSWGRLKLLYR